MRRHALLRKRELLGRERHAREGCPKLGGGHLGQGAPAAADLQHAVTCLHARHAQCAAHLGVLGHAHVAARIALEPGGRIVHRVVQPQRVKRVAQVVVGMDVFLAVGARVAVEQVLDAVQQPPGPGAVDHAFDLLAVGDEKLEQVGEVRCGPVARDVAFGKPDIARPERGAAHVPVLERDRGRWAVAVPEMLQRAIGQLHGEVAMLQPLQKPEGRARRSGCARRQGLGRAGSGGGVHGGLAGLGRHGDQRVTVEAGASGLRWNRTRLSQRRSACQ
jgi:hypothetical protein